MKKRMTEQLRAELAAYLAQYYLPQEELYVKEAVVFSDEEPAVFSDEESAIFSDEEDLPLPMMSSPDISMPDGAPPVCKTDKSR